MTLATRLEISSGSKSTFGGNTAIISSGFVRSAQRVTLYNLIIKLILKHVEQEAILVTVVEFFPESRVSSSTKMPVLSGESIQTCQHFSRHVHLVQHQVQVHRMTRFSPPFQQWQDHTIVNLLRRLYFHNPKKTCKTTWNFSSFHHYHSTNKTTITRTI